MYATYFVILLFIAYCVWHYTAFNLVTGAGVAANAAWSNVEVELTRRLDLIGNLVEVVKGYAKHESETLVQAISARVQAETVKESVHNAASATSTGKEVQGALADIFMLAENYPEIRADKQFLTLQSELANTENRIAASRKAYNQTVSKHTNLCQQFPSSLIAWVHEVKPLSFFDLPDDQGQAPISVGAAFGTAK